MPWPTTIKRANIHKKTFFIYRVMMITSMLHKPIKYFTVNMLHKLTKYFTVNMLHKPIKYFRSLACYIHKLIKYLTLPYCKRQYIPNRINQNQNTTTRADQATLPYRTPHHTTLPYLTLRSLHTRIRGKPKKHETINHAEKTMDEC